MYLFVLHAGSAECGLNIYSKGYKMLNLFAKNLELLDNNDMIILVPKKNMNFNYVVTSQYLLKS